MRVWLRNLLQHLQRVDGWVGSTQWMGGQRNVDDCQPQADGWAAGKHIGRQASGGASGEHSEEASYYIGDTQAQAVTLSISWLVFVACLIHQVADGLLGRHARQVQHHLQCTSGAVY